ncbi:MAG: DUF1801 domain-containing protein, partial [Betaproteobacteria bacterium]
TQNPSVAAQNATTDTDTPDWRGATLDHIRQLIQSADSAVVEELKWRKPSNGMRGVPVWSRAGIICTGETYKDKVKLTFAKGASLQDPGRLFNASLDGNTRRAIDIQERKSVDAGLFQALVREAVALNLEPSKATAKRARQPVPR